MPDRPDPPTGPGASPGPFGGFETERIRSRDEVSSAAAPRPRRGLRLGAFAPLAVALLALAVAVPAMLTSGEDAAQGPPAGQPLPAEPAPGGGGSPGGEPSPGGAPTTEEEEPASAAEEARADCEGAGGDPLCRLFSAPDPTDAAPTYLSCREEGGEAAACVRDAVSADCRSGAPEEACVALADEAAASYAECRAGGAVAGTCVVTARP